MPVRAAHRAPGALPRFDWASMAALVLVTTCVYIIMRNGCGAWQHVWSTTAL